MKPYIFLFLLIFTPITIFAQNIVINEVMSSNQNCIYDEDGDTSDWIELYNNGNQDVNLEGYYLSDDIDENQKWQFGSVILKSSEFLLVFASDKDKVTENSQYHTNFKISASGETIVLSNASGAIIDQVDVPSLGSDKTYSRFPDGEGSWEITFPTPAMSNRFENIQEVTAEPGSGFYYTPLSVTLCASGCKIFYTLDGSNPDSTTTKYTESIEISKTTVLKAVAIQQNNLPSTVITYNYFIGVDTELPIISLSTDPDNLFDYHTGIYANGPGWTPENPHKGANYWMDWERPAHIEFYDDDKNLGFSENCVISIHGGWTRANPQKSLAVKFKGDYGVNKIEYELFPGFEVTTFKAFILRNSGNDFGRTHIRDAFMHALIKDLDIDYQEYRPAITYINGKYWGIYNIREKINEHYIANRHGVDPDNIDMLERHALVVHGDNEHYLELYNYLRWNNVTTKSAYNYINSKIDIDECLLYFASEAYFNNSDWPVSNIKYWRERSEDGKWRWILYDIDMGFNRNIYDGHAQDRISAMFSPDAYNTTLQRRLVENPIIKNRFINQIADLLNTNFKTDRVVNLINIFAEHIKNDIDDHNERWSVTGESKSGMILFAEKRPYYLRKYVREYFNCGYEGNISLNTTPGGSIKLNTLTLTSDQMPWEGIYFKKNIITIKAIPDDGYQFAGWSGSVNSQEDSISIFVTDTTNLHANFTIDTDVINEIVINEINYNSSDSFDPGDWIELYNRSDQIVDMSGWMFSDSDTSHKFLFPAGTRLDPDKYLVLVQDRNVFQSHFPYIKNYIGEMDFGLSGSGEMIVLKNNKNETVDSLVYDDNDPWPEEPDGNGSTLILLNPDSDNSKSWNWGASSSNGSPGMANDIIIEMPLAHFTADTLSGIVPLSINFTDSSTGTITSWFWEFGDDSTSQEQNPTHTYVKVDTYFVSLTVAGPGGESTEKKENYIVVAEPPPIARFFVDTIIGNSPFTVHFSDSSTGVINTWLWEFGDDSISQEQHPIHTYTEIDTYTVALTISGPGGTDSEIKEDCIIVLEPPPVALFTADTMIGYSPFTVHFSDTSEGTITAWLWDFGDGSTSQEQHPVHIYQEPDTYTVSLTVTGPQGMDTIIKEDCIIVTENAPVARFVADTLSGIVPLTIHFADNSIGKVTNWCWDFGDQKICYEKNPTHIYTKADTYSVALKVTGPGGSHTNTKKKYILAKENPPIAQFYADSTQGVVPLTVSFVDSSSGTITSWLWDFGDGNTSQEQDPTHVYETADTFNVTLIITGPWGSDTLSKTSYIHVIDLSGIDPYSFQAPQKFALYQNYPNPFNPSTKIGYSVKDPCYVYLIVYNIKGQIIETLVDAYQQRGNYSMDYNTSELASGIYFYRIKMNDFNDVRKMVKLE